MIESEYRARVLKLQEDIEFNKKHKFIRVAARYERMLGELKREHEQEFGETEEEEKKTQSLLDGDSCNETTEWWE